MIDKIYVFDDGSIASKLLQYEYKDKYNVQVIKVNKSDDLVEQFTKVSNKDKIKIHLPLTVEDLVENNEYKRREIQKVESLGFRNLIVLPYEGHSNDYIKQKAKEAGITEDESEEFDFDPDKLPATAGFSVEELDEIKIDGPELGNKYEKKESTKSSKRKSDVQYLP